LPDEQLADIIAEVAAVSNLSFVRIMGDLDASVHRLRHSLDKTESQLRVEDT
jgi:hypothetical protein